MRPPEGERLEALHELMLDHSWTCPGGMPRWTLEQLAEWASVADSWFREEFAPKRKPVTVPKEHRPKPKRVDGVTSSEVPQRIRDAVLARDKWRCTYCGIPIDRLNYSLHHRRPRGMGGSRRLHTMANLVTLCGSGVDGCHGVVERDRPTSRRTGWLVPNGKTPDQWPVLRRTPIDPDDPYSESVIGWWQPGDRWLPARPHPDQADDESQGVA